MLLQPQQISIGFQICVTTLIFLSHFEFDLKWVVYSTAWKRRKSTWVVVTIKELNLALETRKLRKDSENGSCAGF